MSSVTIKKHRNGLEYIDVNTPLSKARVFLQGAQIDQFQPVGKAPLLWVSSADNYQPGSGIRGGIPVCWPWFGMNDNPDWPQHGFARTRLWTLESVQIKNQTVELKLTLKISEADKLYWPHDTRVEILFTLTDTLTVSLKNTNLACYSVSLTQALHSYFPVKNIHQLKATGFKGSKYIEFAKGPFKQHGDEVLFDKETDRVYTQLADVQELHTPDGIIEVSRENSQSAVLWNPWIDKSQRLPRFNSDDYQTMVCLEAANVREDKLTLAPDETHVLITSIGWKD
ncbi:MAG: D-hexose-6-phosphate mutarotase [Shewanella sp.]